MNVHGLSELKHLQTQLQAQLERLQALAKVNPLVRPEEIAHFEQMQRELTDYIGKARLKFDAIRVIVASHE